MIIQAEIDRLYTGIAGALRIDDKAIGRVINMLNSSDEVQMWNPWADKAATLDMPPQAYKRMLCVEAAEIAEPVTLAPNESRKLSTLIWVES
jgi:glucose-6-phosphate 1-epimerase